MYVLGHDKALGIIAGVSDGGTPVAAASGRLAVGTISLLDGGHAGVFEGRSGSGLGRSR